MLPAELGHVPPLPEALFRARATIVGALGELLAVRDDRLAGTWPWRGEVGEADVRYGFYHLFERFEKAANAVARLDLPRSRAADILGQATAARWDLHGLLVPLAAELDRDPSLRSRAGPGGGEWTIRQTMGHVVSVQASYAARTIYAVHRIRKDPSLAVAAPDQVYQRIPHDEAGAGSTVEILGRLDAWLDAGAAWLVGVADDLSLEAPTIWGGYDVDVHFRLHRWSAHLREHAIQIEKTLALLGRQPTEVERLVRLLFGGYGWLEAHCLGIALEGDAGRLLADCAAFTSDHVGELLAASA